MRREAAHVELVDDQILDRDLQRPIVFPIEIVEREPARDAGRCCSSPALARHTSRPPTTRA